MQSNDKITAIKGLHGHAQDKCLWVFIYEIHSYGVGWLSAIGENTCPGCHTVSNSNILEF